MPFPAERQLAREALFDLGVGEAFPRAVVMLGELVVNGESGFREPEASADNLRAGLRAPERACNEPYQKTASGLLCQETSAGLDLPDAE